MTKEAIVFCFFIRFNKYATHTVLAVEVEVNPCHPSPCGPNSQCTERNKQAICTCLPQFFGAPPNCRPECVVNSECPLNKACVNQKCVDPCPGVCGQNAMCTVLNHSPYCTCQDGFSGNPFTRCYQVTIAPRKNRDKIFSSMKLF